MRGPQVAAALTIFATSTAGITLSSGGANAAASLSTPYCTPWKQTGNRASTYRYCATLSKKSTGILGNRPVPTEEHRPKEGSRAPLRRPEETYVDRIRHSVREGEAEAIFAKAETQVTGTLEHSTEAEVGSGIVYNVRPKSWGHCRYGSALLTVWGTAYEEINKGKISRAAAHTFKTTFPAVATWVVGPGQL